MMCSVIGQYAFVIPALGAGIHALGAARCKGVDAGTKSWHDGGAYGSRT
jgi:hypothetical protein